MQNNVILDLNLDGQHHKLWEWYLIVLILIYWYILFFKFLNGTLKLSKQYSYNPKRNIHTKV